jgi:hypothetical protein
MFKFFVLSIPLTWNRNQFVPIKGNNLNKKELKKNKFKNQIRKV